MGKANTNNTDPDKDKSVGEIRAEERAKEAELKVVRERRSRKEKSEVISGLSPEKLSLVGKTVQINVNTYLRLGEITIDENGVPWIGTLLVETVSKELFAHEPFLSIRQDRIPVVQAFVWTEFVDPSLFDDVFKSTVSDYRKIFKIDNKA